MFIKVVGGIIKKEDRYLIGRRGPKEKMAGFWEFPGGKLEENESKKECIKRELKEELDVVVVVGELISEYKYSYSDISYHLYFYRIDDFIGEPIPFVHDRLIWAKSNDFKKYNFLPGDNPLIDLMLNNKV